MIDINPFCDSDIRNGMQFLSGVNLMIIGIAIIIDGLAIGELLQFSETWNPTSFYLPVYASYILLGCDIFVNFIQLLCGWTLYSSVTRKAYRRIPKLYYPCLALYVIELGLLVCYLVSIPSSPFFYYFSLLTFLYKGYLFWPMKRFMDDHSHHQPRFHATERTRLLASVG